jgi:hypothetical protein
MITIRYYQGNEQAPLLIQQASGPEAVPQVGDEVAFHTCGEPRYCWEIVRRRWIYRESGELDGVALLTVRAAV